MFRSLYLLILINLDMQVIRESSTVTSKLLIFSLITTLKPWYAFAQVFALIIERYIVIIHYNI